jgi:glutathione S-transferase
MIVVHHLENSRSLRVLWMLEELGLAYELRQYTRDPHTLLAPAELRKIHALGKAPVLQDGERVLAESGAILEYLADMHDSHRAFSPPLVPADDDERMAYRYWMHYAEGSAMPPMLLTLVVSRIRSAPMPFFARPIARAIADKAEAGFVGPQRRLHLDWMEQRLANSAWFAGERFTAADIQMSYPIQAASGLGDGLQDKPNLQAFLQRIEQRPAYQRAVARGGKVQAMKEKMK